MTGFTVIPAVDIKGGRCVRLYRGHAEEETVFDEDPVSAARFWEEEGASRLHVVDLDGAFKGEPVNHQAIKEIISTVHIPVQVGGGIRTRDTAAGYIEAGAARVVIGTVAFKDQALLAMLIEELKDRLIVGVDVQNGCVTVHGWKGETDISAIYAVRDLKESGVGRIIYTEVDRDGTLAGPDFNSIENLARAEISGAGIAMIASGGVHNTDDISRLAALEGQGVEGVIVGMALYKKAFTLQQAIEATKTKGHN